jgi:hypothetical protein
MKTLTIPYEEGLALSMGESPAGFEAEARFLLALKFFELGRLSAGKAAEWCGISKPLFLRKASDAGVPVVRLDPDQFDIEFGNA